MILPGPITPSSALSRAFSRARLARAAMLGNATLAFAWALHGPLRGRWQSPRKPRTCRRWRSRPLRLLPHSMTGPGSTWAAILAMRGEARVGLRTAPGRRRSPARSVCFSRSTLSPKREASSRAFKWATTTGSRTASSSAPRSTRRSRPFPIAPASRSAAARRSLRRSSAQKAMASRCCPSAPCEVVSATRPEIGSFYATGGLAWTYDRAVLTQLGNGATDRRFLWRFGWAAGAGVEVPIAPHWTATLEYLLDRLRQHQRDLSDRRAADQCRFLPARAALGRELPLRQRCGSGESELDRGRRARCGPRQFSRAGHVRRQGYPPFRSPYAGRQQPARQRPRPRDRRRSRSTPACGCGRAPKCGSIPRSIRALASTIPMVRPGFRARRPTSSARRTPYARLQRVFPAPDHRSRRRHREGRSRHQSVRRLAGGEPPRAHGRQVRDRRHLRHQQIRQQSEKRFPQLDADQCRHVRLCRRRLGLHLRRGRRMVSGSLDAARRRVRSVGDAGRRSKPAGGYRSIRPSSSSSWSAKSRSATSCGDSRARSSSPAFSAAAAPGSFADAVALAAADRAAGRHQRGARLHQPARRQPQSRTAGHRDVGVFARAGWADGNVEPWDFTDIDRTVSGGISLSGKSWGRPDDTVGIAGVINGITGVHIAVPQRRRPRHPHRRRATAESRAREDLRGLLQLRALRFDAS